MCVCVIFFFHCQTAGPIRLKFGMWSPSSRMGVNNHVCVAMGMVLS